MIDDKKIEEAKDSIFNRYFLKRCEGMVCVDHISEPVYLDYQIKQAIELGAKWAINELLKDLWHPASEIPCEGKYLVVEYNVTDTIKDYLSFKRLEGYLGWNWIPYCKSSNVTKWLYIGDLLPKKEN